MIYPLQLYLLKDIFEHKNIHTHDRGLVLLSKDLKKISLYTLYISIIVIVPSPLL